MSSLNESLKELENHLKQKCGNDLKIIIARHKSFGNSDNCFLIYGENALTAIEILKHGIEAKVEELQGGGFLGSDVYTYYSFSFTEC